MVRGYWTSGLKCSQPWPFPSCSRIVKYIYIYIYIYTRKKNITDKGSHFFFGRGKLVQNSKIQSLSTVLL